MNQIKKTKHTNLGWMVFTFLLSFVLFAPYTSHAQQTIGTFIVTLQRTVATAIAPLLAFALLSFFYGVIKYLSASRKSPDAAIKGRSVILWGVFVLFIAVSVFGIVQVIRTTFGL